MILLDLGSGDGRIVFRASQYPDIFKKSIGVEINPLLHSWASTVRIAMGPKIWATTQFKIQDIWKADLSFVDVVTVYGLGPIMKPLGIKLEKELKPGSVVISNVFTFPGWQASSLSNNGVFFYRIPQALQRNK